ncbi:MAG: hypothetical protein FWH29_03550 [Methanobrevibacter sp.]|nr:hypothetical protein [Methanobrevibacter sp.]
MTTRFDENNIVDYLHKFEKVHIRRNPKYNDKIKKRKFSPENHQILNRRRTSSY